MTTWLSIADGKVALVRYTAWNARKVEVGGEVYHPLNMVIMSLMRNHRMSLLLA